MQTFLTRLVAGALAFGAAGVAYAQCDAGERLFEHATGGSCIPIQPERIAAPRGDSVATPLIDIGAPGRDS